MTETAKIAEALSAFQAEMPVVTKGHTAKVTSDKGNYSYTYAGLADITAVAMPLLTKHGLAFSACPKQGERGYELVGLLLHTSGESLSGSLPIMGNRPQEIGSSLTYGRRYLFGCMTGLVTDDDDDGATASAPARPQQTDNPMTPGTRGRMFATFAKKGVAEEAQLAGINRITGKDYQSRGDLTERDAKAVIEALKLRPDAPDTLADIPTPEPTTGGE